MKPQEIIRNPSYFAICGASLGLMRVREKGNL